jgi:sodium-dependent dicarboxylate transporter 2/3/5
MSAYGKRERIGLFAGPIAFLVVLSMPLPEGMHPAALSVAAVTLLMAVWWVTEAIPIPATALLPIVLLPALGVMKTGQVTAQYGHPLIFLFIGGFLIAKAMEKCNLHERIALQVIRSVGTSPSRLVLGFMAATAFLSMWISNTATAMMMLPIGLAVIREAVALLQDRGYQVGKSAGDFRFAVALMLGIAYGASIGGVATIIGTPPNAVLVGMVDKLYGLRITFASWMAFGFPLSVVMLVLSWLYLVKLVFRPEIAELPGGRALITQRLERLGPMSGAEARMLAVFAAVALAWILRGFVHVRQLALVDDTTIAITGAVVLFVIPADLAKGEFLLDWKHAVQIPWGVVILFGGGLALAAGFQASALDRWIGAQLSVLAGVPMFVLLLSVVVVVIFLTEITSNTATATVFVPIMGGLAVAMGIHPLGLTVAAAVAASYAFMLPVATPPNAVVFGSGYLSVPQMAKAGLALNLLGSLLITLFLYLWLPLVWKIDLNTLPQRFLGG